MMDLTKAVVFCPGASSALESRAVAILVEEIQKRTGVELEQSSVWPYGTGRPVIALGKLTELEPHLLRSSETPPQGTLGDEGYKLWSIADSEAAMLQVWIAGADERGVLYGVGRFLRLLTMNLGSIVLDTALSLSETPRFPLRGTQLAYRPKNHSYDAWTVAQFDQYIRELALFGANSIEILPPRTDDDLLSPVMQEDPMTMMVRIGEIIDSYGMDTWIWYPNVGEDYSDPDTVREELAEREDVFARLPNIKAVLIPGGDPGYMEVDTLFVWCSRVAEVLRKHHPEATLWISPQVMDSGVAKRWLDEFYAQVRMEPEWLGGIVFGAWVRTPLNELRRLVPERYPIRRYEDICHNYRCQYPVHYWDQAYALTYTRESINPRPTAFKHIHNLRLSESIGNITYSEGIGDDVNKFVFLDQDWNPDIPVIHTLRDYGRLFAGPDYTEQVAQGMLALERNWEGPLLTNGQVETTFKQWRAIEEKAEGEGLLAGNYRLQMGLLRAYYDVYQRRRLVYEMELERQAVECLGQAGRTGPGEALDAAERILKRTIEQRIAVDIRQRCEELADSLFHLIGAQTSVEKHHAIQWERGAFMSTIDTALNDAEYYLEQIDSIRRLPAEVERLQAISALLNRTDPGPGGFYDSFVSNSQSLKLVDFGTGWQEDPGHLATPRTHFEPSLLHMDDSRKKVLGGIPRAWLGSISALYQVPLTITYDSIDPQASYSIRVTYTSRASASFTVKLRVNERFVVHEGLDVQAVRTVEAPIPKEAGQGGRFVFSFDNLDGDRGQDIAEIWIIRNQ